MSVRLKPISQQVMVITGASSGIGLATARMAARRGTRLVLVSRSEDALSQLVREITAAGGEAIYVVADVGRESEVRRVADAAIRHFGAFDTWVNNAGVSIYGRTEDIPIEDERQLFETDFWGVVNGSKVAVEHLRRRGGALINIGSVVSDRSIPLQAMYSASKHAVQGFTDSLRMEIEKENAPVSVTLVKPSSIDTPFTGHAKNYMGSEPNYPPPVYSPDVVADAILYCAEHPRREMTVGGGGRMIALLGMYMPRVMDKVMEWTMFSLQKKRQPAPVGREGSLRTASESLQERGGYPGHVRQTSFYTKVMEHPMMTGALLMGAGLMLATMLSESDGGTESAA